MGDRFDRLWAVGKPLVGVLDALGVFRAYRRRRPPRTVILTYHSISTREDLPGLTTSPASFARHMAYLAEHFEVIPLAETYQSAAPRDRVAITFDDGYVDNFDHAYPVLRKHGFPATIFVIAKEIGQPGYCTLEQLKEMAEGGIEIGGHTVTHPELSLCNEEQLEAEIVEGRRVVSEQLGLPLNHFAYPYGNPQKVGTKAQALAKSAGYEAAVMMVNGEVRPDSPRFELPRIGIRECSVQVLAARLSGFFESPGLRRWLRRLGVPG